MREILFKAKRVDNGEWVEGSLVKLNDDNYCIYEFGKADLYAPIVIPETVCQFIGVLDDNGNKIFVGDLVKFSCPRNGSFTESIIIYDSEEARFGIEWEKNRIPYWFEEIDDIKIIGNIHDK